MRLGQDKKLPINGITQFRQVPVAKLRHQHHAIGFQVVDHPRAPGDQLVGPAVFGLVRHKADFSLFELPAQPFGVEYFQLARHDLHQQLLKPQPYCAFFFLAIAVPLDHFVVETLAAAAHEIAVNRGAQADAGGLDGLVGHG